ncbi:MAG: hypothetical protein WBB36_12325, partial [Chitinophagales bacterium]
MTSVKNYQHIDFVSVIDCSPQLAIDKGLSALHLYSVENEVSANSINTKPKTYNENRNQQSPNKNSHNRQKKSMDGII